MQINYNNSLPYSVTNKIIISMIIWEYLLYKMFSEKAEFKNLQKYENK